MEWSQQAVNVLDGGVTRGLGVWGDRGSGLEGCRGDTAAFGMGSSLKSVGPDRTPESPNICPIRKSKISEVNKAKFRLRGT